MKKKGKTSLSGIQTRHAVWHSLGDTKLNDLAIKDRSIFSMASVLTKTYMAITRQGN